MNYRDRVIRTIHFKDVDELPFRHAYGLMPGVLEDWHAQGLPVEVQTEQDIYAFFGFPSRPLPLPISPGFDPPFESHVIEDTAEQTIAIDGYGRKTKLLKQYASLPLPMNFPVKDWDTWLPYKERLVFSAKRIGADLTSIARKNIETGLLNNFGGTGFYWLPRDLMGDEQLCISYYEQPDLVKDILETWCGLIEKLISVSSEKIKLDAVHFGEDMAYKNAGMVSPAIFKEFIRPYYLRIQALVERRQIPIFSVDSDGCLNELAEWFVECGVNYIGPNEVQAGNDITAYRRRFGKRLAYDGGLEKQTLTRDTAAIENMLENTIPYMKSTGGGWTVCLDHRVVRGTPLNNFKFYIDHVRQMIKM